MSSPSRKRSRDEDEDEPEYPNEDRSRVGTPEPGSKRPRVESHKASLVSSSPSPKRKVKGKSQVHSVGDTALPLPTSPFHVPPSPMPRFGPQDRCNICPLYKPAVPGYETQKLRAEDGKLSDVGDGSDSSSGPERG